MLYTLTTLIARRGEMGSEIFQHVADERVPPTSNKDSNFTVDADEICLGELLVKEFLIVNHAKSIFTQP